MNKLWHVYKCIMCSWMTKETVLCDLTYSWIRSARVLKNVIDTTRLSSTAVLLHKFPHIWISNLWSKNQACACQQQEGFILYNNFVLSSFESIYFKYFKSLQQGKIWAYHLKQYVITCFHIQSWIIIYKYFGYLPGLYFVSYRTWQFYY